MSNGSYDVNTLRTFALIYPDEIFGNHGQVVLLQQATQFLDAEDLVIRFKQENPRWGYKKIRDQVVYIGYNICKSSVRNILIEHGYDPEPDLTVRSTWHEFIKSHWDVLTACDFFTVELLVGRRLIRCTLFFVMELATRKVLFGSRIYAGMSFCTLRDKQSFYTVEPISAAHPPQNPCYSSRHPGLLKRRTRHFGWGRD